MHHQAPPQFHSLKNTLWFFQVTPIKKSDNISFKLRISRMWGSFFKKILAVYMIIVILGTGEPQWQAGGRSSFIIATGLGQPRFDSRRFSCSRAPQHNQHCPTISATLSNTALQFTLQFILQCAQCTHCKALLYSAHVTARTV